MEQELLAETSESRPNATRFAEYFGGTVAVILCIMLTFAHFVSWDFAYIMALSSCVLGGHLCFYRFEEREAPTQMIAGACAVLFIGGMTVPFTASFLRILGVPDRSLGWMVLMSVCSIGVWVAFIEFIDRAVRRHGSDQQMAYPKWLVMLAGATSSALFLIIVFASGVKMT
ncbi:hypothetical protein A3C09_01310 [Candidatus Uhrbacteria bacterium RIFCSPHIGHO2_02_FULL_47_44]|uniref:Uncharacterized protein n=1 Tax=Candidatus Uhrbacteria bacterium RIFCSPLOWO2_02_FULL_48_18 TaxID=1802408 RepID=A0A1F7VA09_9BACT|nr:MAG: hypothetical protein A2839_00020 [Candidatus Uhrbacteria bacterium RIFCSPHIGHO2_01_FULL_47_10]OGL69804.1 MAG: hypothetical protein A3C09_01310 [Candidatus Uhrbacteria bacterium RIFCSPHIGHO2_02_FULL_47_44]OGL77424.1 MAG: hypothetical protein A3E97_00360 [Candidatus Uhrbacteria bacterium RIFCSPHIGHO2_12_FULL_47_12]OGL81785.1 MAG: hypothetical protein A3B20_01675 [Candidatus Uhrbacteria bacterium RIFCSPLOWO2_01_FULL_47_17]OGL86948.1 MAG: hypothetical protein A3I41_03265 [Candidatus Uhrbact